MTTNRAELILSATDKTKAAFASASNSLDALKSRAGIAKGEFVALGSMITGALALAGAKGRIDLLDQLDDLAEKTGITVEKLSELRFAGEATGTPLEALATGVGRLSKQMAEAAGGGKEAVQTFKTLVVEVKNADGTLRSSDQVLGDLADRFASYEDGAAKAALAQRIFGKSGADMIPVLNQGRDGIEKLRQEAQALGAIYGGDLAREAAAFNDNLAKLRISSEAAALALAGPLIKSLGNITNQMLEVRKEAGLLNAVLVTIGGGVARTLGMDDVGGAQMRAKEATGEMQRYSRLMDGVQLTLERDPGNTMAQRRLATYRGKIEALQKTAAAASEELKALANNADPASDPNKRREDRGFKPDLSGNKTSAPIVPSGDGAGSKKKKAKDEEEAAKRYLESLDKMVERTKELSQVETALAEIQRIRAEGGVVTEAMKQEILLRAATVDATKEQQEAEKNLQKEQEERQKRFFELQDEGDRVFEETRTAAESYNAELKRLNDLWKAGAITADTHARAVQRSGDAYDEAQKRTKEAANQQDEFTKRLAGNIQDSLGSSLADLAEGNFKNIGDGFSKMLTRMLADAAAAQLSRAMFGDLAEGGEGNGFFGGALRTFGEVLGAGSTKKKAGGTNSLDAFLKSNNAFGTAGGEGAASASATAFSSALTTSTAQTNLALGALTTAANSAAVALGSSGGAGGLGGIASLVGGGYSAADQAGLDELIAGLASYDTGTNFVPEDMIAKIHKGERIVPAAQNRPGFGGVNQNLVFHVSGPIDRRTQSQIAVQAGAAINAALSRHT